MDVNDISQAAQNGLTRFFEFLPLLAGAILIWIIGYFIAKLLETVIERLLRATTFDEMLLNSSAGTYLGRMINQPSDFIGSVVFWLTYLGFISLALTSLDIDGLNAFMGTVYAYIPHVIVALVIFLASSAVSMAAVTFVKRVMGDTALARTIEAVVPSIVMSIAVFMILNELMIATEIVIITYTALVGAVALGMALAFGLGGRDVAGRLLEQAYVSGRNKAATVRGEVKQAAQNARQEVAAVEPVVRPRRSRR